MLVGICTRACVVAATRRWAAEAARAVVAEAQIAAEILRQVAARGPGRTLCPSEVARALSPEWRDLMPAVRAEAGRMQAAGQVQATQRGLPVDPVAARGPIRLGMPPGPQSD